MNAVELKSSLLYSINSIDAADISTLTKVKDALQNIVIVIPRNKSAQTDEKLFRMYLDDWQSDTRFLSSVKAVTNHPAFKSIVNMGGNAVPFIIAEIERRPSNLVWALNAIYHKKIGSGSTITEACRLWIAELKKS